VLLVFTLCAVFRKWQSLVWKLLMWVELQSNDCEEVVTFEDRKPLRGSWTASCAVTQAGCNAFVFMLCNNRWGSTLWFPFNVFVSVATRSQTRSVLLTEVEELLWAMASGISLPHHPLPSSDSQSVATQNSKSFLFWVSKLCYLQCFMFRGRLTTIIARTSLKINYIFKPAFFK
jgi:hypothetical protein